MENLFLWLFVFFCPVLGMSKIICALSCALIFSSSAQLTLLFMEATENKQTTLHKSFQHVKRKERKKGDWEDTRTSQLLVAFEPSDGGGWSAGHGSAVQLNLFSLNSDFFLDINYQIAWWD